MSQHKDYNGWGIEKLSDHINDTHHVYVRKASKEINELGNKVAQAYATNHSELKEITETFQSLSTALEEHLQGEEKYLFPYIEKLNKAKIEGNKLPKPGFGSIDVPLKQHYEDHENAQNLMKKIDQLTNGFNAPSEANEELKSYYQQLKAFANDLTEHIYVENEVLFQQAIDLEKEVVE